MVNGRQTDATQSTHRDVGKTADAGVSGSNGFHTATLSDMQKLNQASAASPDVPHLSIVDSNLAPMGPIGFDSSPWSQPVMEKAGGLAGIFGFKQSDTAGGVIEKRTVAGLSDGERSAYEKEEKAAQRYISGQSSHMPDMPEHKKVADLVAKQEKDIEQKVFDSMSPEDQQKYLTAKKQYDGANADFAKTDGTKPFPQMPPEVTAFNAAVAKAVGGVQSFDEPGPTQTARATDAHQPSGYEAGGASPWLGAYPPEWRQQPSGYEAGGASPWLGAYPPEWRQQPSGYEAGGASPWLGAYTPEMRHQNTDQAGSGGLSAWLDKLPDPFHLFH